jgi:hypothetical protein
MQRVFGDWRKLAGQQTFRGRSVTEVSHRRLSLGIQGPRLESLGIKGGATEAPFTKKARAPNDSRYASKDRLKESQ